MKKRIVIVTAVCLLAAVGSVIAWQASAETDVEKVKRIGQNLVDEKVEPPEGAEREQVLDQLIINVDRLPADQRQQVWEELREQHRTRMEQGIKQFAALPDDEAQRKAFLDQELIAMSRWRTVMWAHRPQDTHIPRRHRQSAQEEIAAEQAARAAERAKQPEGAADDDRRRGRSRGDRRRRWAEQQGAEPSPERAYWRALMRRHGEKRAEARGETSEQYDANRRDRAADPRQPRGGDRR